MLINDKILLKLNMECSIPHTQLTLKRLYLDIYILSSNWTGYKTSPHCTHKDQDERKRISSCLITLSKKE